MQRWLADRERRWRVAVAAGMMALFVVALLVAPGLVLSAAQSRAGARGLSLEVEDTDLGFSGISFQNVRLRWLDDAHDLARIRRAVVDVSWTGLLGGGAIQGVSLEGGQFMLSASDVARMRKSRSAPAPGAQDPASGARQLPAIAAQDLELVVRDAAGDLVRAQGVTALVEEGRFQLRAQELTLGSQPGDTAIIKTLQVQGRLEGRRPLLTAASSQSALLVWAAESAAVSKPGDPFPAGRGRTLARVRAFRDGLRADGEPQKQADPAASRRALWADDARIGLHDMRVVEGTQNGPAILEGLDVALAAAGPDALRFTGKGRAPASGELAWDLRFEPGELRVEGTLALHDVSLALFGPVLPPLPFEGLERTRVRADLALTGRGLESVAVKGALTIQDLAFASEGLAHTPVGPFTFEARGEGTWTPARRELSGIQARIATGALKMSMSGVLAWPKDGYRVDLLAELPKSHCSDVLASVPAGLLDELSTVQLDGTLGGKLTVHVDAADLDATKVDFDIKDACKFAAVPPLLDLRRFQQPFMHRVEEPDGTLFEMETGPGTPNWVPIEQVSPFFIQAVISHEDGRFFGHRGFAEPEIASALARNLKAKAFKFGASTITMQLVKNVFLHREKLLARKVQEAFIVWWLEQTWDKRHILELYLNVIEYGPALYGIRNASLHYFGALPMDLTPAQAAFLATILPSPKTSHSYYENKALTSSAKNRIASLLKHMRSRDRIDDEALAYGLAELDHFSFYDPTQPPPVPPEIKGKAQPPPFDMAVPAYPAWDVLPFDVRTEDGSYGAN